MKRVGLLFAIAGLLLLAVGGCLIITDPEVIERPYYELDFGDEPLGPLTAIENVRGIRYNTQPEVVESPARTGKSIKLTAPPSEASWGDAFYYILPTPIQERLTIETWLYAESHQDRSAVLFASTLGGPIYGDGVSLYFYNNGELRYFDTAFRLVDSPYAAQRWVHLLIEIDVTAKCYDIYVDDMTTPVAQAPFRDPRCGEIQIIGFSMYTDSVQAQPVYIDSLIIR